MGATLISQTQTAHCSLKRRLGRRRAMREAKQCRQRPYLCPVCHHWHLTTLDRDGWR